MIDNNLYKVLFDHKYVKEFITRDTKDALSLNESQRQIDYYNSENDALKMKLKRTIKLYQDGYISYEEFTKENLTIKNAITDNDNKIQTLKNESDIINNIDIDKIYTEYENATDFNIKRDFVVKYVNEVKIYKIETADIDWPNPLQKNEKIIYAEVTAFNYKVPIKVLMTPYSKNSISSNSLQYLPDYNTIIDTNKKRDHK
jgi:hypothetical protein